MWLNPVLLRTVLAIALGTLAAAGICLRLGRPTAYGPLWPPHMISLAGGGGCAERLRFARTNFTGGPVQPELLKAALAAANENGALMLAVRRNRCSCQMSQVQGHTSTQQSTAGVLMRDSGCPVAQAEALARRPSASMCLNHTTS